jgi:hypothetical protein
MPVVLIEWKRDKLEVPFGVEYQELYRKVPNGMQHIAARLYQIQQHKVKVYHHSERVLVTINICTFILLLAVILVGFLAFKEYISFILGGAFCLFLLVLFTNGSAHDRKQIQLHKEYLEIFEILNREDENRGIHWQEILGIPDSDGQSSKYISVSYYF